MPTGSCTAGRQFQHNSHLPDTVGRANNCCNNPWADNEMPTFQYELVPTTYMCTVRPTTTSGACSATLVFWCHASLGTIGDSDHRRLISQPNTVHVIDTTVAFQSWRRVGATIVITTYDPNKRFEVDSQALRLRAPVLLISESTQLSTLQHLQ